jgi:hypothetical protein
MYKNNNKKYTQYKTTKEASQLLQRIKLLYCSLHCKTTIFYDWLRFKPIDL